MKNILLLFISLLYLSGTAQNLPGLDYVRNLPQTFNYNKYKTSCISDSVFYCIRYNGVQSCNLRTGEVRYKFKGLYGASQILPDGHGKVIVARGSNILLYDQSSDSVTDLTHGNTYTIYDMGITDHKIWILSSNNILQTYGGGSWHNYPLPSTSYYNRYSYLLTVDDVTAYLSDGRRIWSFMNGTVDSIYNIPGQSYYHMLWDLDSSGRAWISAGKMVVKVDINGASTIYDTSTIPFLYNDAIDAIAAGNGDNTAISGEYLYLYNGTSWNAQSNNYYTYRPLFLTSDKSTGEKFYMVADSLFSLSAAGKQSCYVSNMPYKNVKAITNNYIATTEGLFVLQGNGASPLTPTNFFDTSSKEHADDITCFEVIGGNNGYYPYSGTYYGTHHGVYGIYNNPINNASLPDTNINCIYSLDGSYYIGTDKGLAIYNQVFYLTFDTSNSPLPSNKITYITSGSAYQSGSGYSNILYIGTDKGLGIYSNGQWRIYDTSSIGTNSFYVTGILPQDNNSPYIDSSLWVTTKGNGLVLLNDDNSYQLYNKANGRLTDDTLYFASKLAICEFGSFRYIGTNDSGIAYPEQRWTGSGYDTLDFRYATSAYGYNYTGQGNFHSSKLFATQNNSSLVIVVDSGFLVSQECVGIIEHQAPAKTLKWYQKDEKLYIIIPDDLTGHISCEIYDMTGRDMSTTAREVNGGAHMPMDVSALADGIYILRANCNGVIAQTKFTISR